MPADGPDRGTRARRGIRFADRALFAGTLVRRHVASRLSRARCGRGGRAGGGCGYHAPGPAFRPSHPPARRSDGPHRPRRLHAGRRRQGGRRAPRPGRFHQSHDRAAGPIRARGPPQRAASHPRATRGRHGPSTSQRGYRRADGDRTAPASMRGRAGRGPRSGPAAASADGIIPAAVPHTQPPQAPGAGNRPAGRGGG